jgi:hypothetical protein
MKRAGGRVWPLFRVWITRYEKWRPSAWDELPPRATAVEPADASAMSAREAIRFLEGFNRTMLTRLLPIWAVAVPVTILYEGDLRIGAIVTPKTAKLLDCRHKARNHEPGVSSGSTDCAQ